MENSGYELSDIFRKDVVWDDILTYKPDSPAVTITMQTINDAIWPPIEVYVAIGAGDEIRAVIDEKFGEQGRRQVTITESGLISPGVAYVYNGQAILRTNIRPVTVSDMNTRYVNEGATES